MKRFLLYLLTLISFFNPLSLVQAQVTENSLDYKILAQQEVNDQIYDVTDYSVIDGDTADLILDRPEEASIKARFLLIDTPELNKAPYSQEAKDRVEELFQQAENIQIQYHGNRKDQYGRDLVYVWLDGILLQEILVTEGLAIARYIDGFVYDSAHVDTIYASQDYALRNKANVWDDGDSHFLAHAEFKDSSSNPYSQGNISLSQDEAQRMVYVAPYSGQRYHFNENCRGLRTANYVSELTLEQAISSGYTLCGYED